MSRSLKLAKHLSLELREPRIVAVKGKYHAIHGTLDVGSTLVSLEIRVQWRFRDVKRKPPAVSCHEPWMKRGADWHNWDQMCWALPEEWRDVMAWKGKPVQWIMDEVRCWLFASARCLINRHYLATLQGLQTWPSEWRYWGHGALGAEEYRREQKVRRLARGVG